MPTPQPETLTIPELQDLTGYLQVKRITQWLDEQDIPYKPGRGGVPKVHRLALAAAMGAPVGVSGPSTTTGGEHEPDLSKIR